tara:strand:+ start:6139 stop:6486 length:348 start_codon:yes stop_codon:yes gene_type:complete
MKTEKKKLVAAITVCVVAVGFMGYQVKKTYFPHKSHNSAQVAWPTDENGRLLSPANSPGIIPGMTHIPEGMRFSVEENKLVPVEPMPHVPVNPPPIPPLPTDPAEPPVPVTEGDE